MAESRVPIDYSSRDYASLRADLINSIPEYVPEWTNRTESDFGIVLIEMFSYVGDILNYYIDRVANEAYLTTAVQRSSVLSLAQMLDYRPLGLAAATVNLSMTASADVGGAVTVPAGTKVSTVSTLGSDPVVFETDEELILLPGATGLVAATEGRTVAEGDASPVGVSTGAPDQVFSLYYPDIIDGSLQLFVDEDGAGGATGVLWNHISHLIDAGSEERAYTTTTDENGVTWIVFGDAVNGRIPTQGAIITAQYRIGLGSKGNVGANSLVEVMVPIVGLESVTNPASASGGADAESIDSIRRQAPRSLTVLERAVTTADYALLAEKVPGVLHAEATASVATNVVLYVAPTGGGAPTQALKDDVDNYLADKKMIGTSVTVADPAYVPVNVTVNPLNVLDQYSRTNVEIAVANAVKELFEIENVDFGFRVTLSQVYRAIQGVPGVDYAVVTELNRTGTGLVDGIPLASNEIPVVGTVTVTSTGGLVGT